MKKGKIIDLTNKEKLKDSDYIELQAPEPIPKANIKIEINDAGLDISLSTLLKNMRWLAERGYEAYLSGCGDGSRNIVFEKRIKK